MTQTIRHPRACWALLATLLIISGCPGPTGERSTPQKSADSTTAEAPEPSGAHPKSKTASSPGYLPVEPLLRLPVSAYHTSLAADRDTIFLLTPKELYTLKRAQPPKHQPIEHQGGAALSSERLLYVHQNRLMELDLKTKETRHRVHVDVPPRILTERAGRVAWLSLDKKGTYEVFASFGASKKRIYQTTNSLSTLTLAGDRVYTIEQLPAAPGRPPRWTVLGLSFDGAPQLRSRTFVGRTPAQIQADDQLFFYFGPERRVYRLALELDQEQVLARDQICSPLELGDALYCYHVTGVSRLSKKGGRPQLLPIKAKATLTTLHASPAGLLWVMDTGSNQLELHLLPYAPASSAVTPHDTAAQ